MKTLLLILITSNLLLATSTHYKVLDRENFEVKNYTLDITKKGDTVVTIMYDEENDINRTDITDPNGFTKEFLWKAEGTDIKGRVDNGILYYEGTFHSKEVNLSIPIDDVPFMFNVRDSLKSFILSDKEEIYMYVTSSNTLGAYKFKATKQGKVKLEIHKVNYDSIEVEFSMAGFIGFFVGGDKLYFDKKSGKFLKRIDSRRDRVELIKLN